MLNAKRIAAALGAAALAGISAPALADDNQVENGFTLETNLNVRLATVGGTGSIGPSPLAPGLLIGYKLNRVIFGLGLEFNNSTSNVTNQTGLGGTVVTTSTTTSNSNFLIGPDVQFAMLRSADTRVELIGDLALHFGHQFSSVSVTVTPAPVGTGPAAPTDSNFLLSYRLGPGVRFWAHKHFALQAATGFTGVAFFDIPQGSAPATGNNSQHSIYTAIGALGTF